MLIRWRHVGHFSDLPEEFGARFEIHIYIYIKYMSWLRNLCVSLWVPTLFVSESTYVGHVSLRTTRPHRHALKLVGTTPSKYYVYRVCGDVAVASSSSSFFFFFFIFNAISFCDSFIFLSPFLEREREMQ